MSSAVAPIVKKKTAHCGCAGHTLCVRPRSHAPVPMALASREAFSVLIEKFAPIQQYATSASNVPREMPNCPEFPVAELGTAKEGRMP